MVVGKEMVEGKKWVWGEGRGEGVGGWERVKGKEWVGGRGQDARGGKEGDTGGREEKAKVGKGIKKQIDQYVCS